jgi:putative Ca2+/H+ antiporter (TMEM165/GDT1 family)
LDWRLLASTFGLVFLAELGDKTQLATLTLAASGKSRGAVFLGAAAALVLTSAVAAIAGEAISRAVPPIWLRRVAGLAFLVLGGFYLLAGE